MKTTEQEQLKTRLAELIAPVLDNSGLELVEIQIAGGARHPIVRVFIDKPGGVTIDDCAAVSRRYAVELDHAEVMDTSYTLEVSSPGLDRPLLTPADFRHRQGLEIQVRLKDSNIPIVGTIVSADHMLVLETSSGTEEIVFERIEKGLVKL